ncbi:MAG: hypothetical protein NTW49_06130 [Bacteroidia bacterium]|nr:hypothetical protein [Bacteroidia bacterium]
MCEGTGKQPTSTGGRFIIYGNMQIPVRLGLRVDKFSVEFSKFICSGDFSLLLSFDGCKRK